MTLQPMYRLKNTIVVQTAMNISASTQEIEVSDITAFASAPNYATIGTDNSAEVIKYNGIDVANKKLTGCLRGQSFTLSKSWDAGTDIANTFTTETLAAIMNNIEALDGELSETNEAFEALQGDVTEEITSLDGRVTAAEGVANNAATTAGQAKTAAESASVTAAAATTTAGQAKTAAEGAATTAGQADTKADNAVSTAQSTQGEVELLRQNVSDVNEDLSVLTDTVANKIVSLGTITVPTTDWQKSGDTYTATIFNAKVPADTATFGYKVYVAWDHESRKAIPADMDTETEAGVYRLILYADKAPEEVITGDVTMMEVKL